MTASRPTLLAGGDARPMETESINGTLVWDAPQDAQITLNAYYNASTGSQTAYSAQPARPTTSKTTQPTEQHRAVRHTTAQICAACSTSPATPR